MCFPLILDLWLKRAAQMFVHSLLISREHPQSYDLLRAPPTCSCSCYTYIALPVPRSAMFLSHRKAMALFMQQKRVI